MTNSDRSKADFFVCDISYFRSLTTYRPASNLRCFTDIGTSGLVVITSSFSSMMLVARAILEDAPDQEFRTKTWCQAYYGQAKVIC
jgi:hypothetical protein